MARKSEWQEIEAASHIGSTVRKKKTINVWYSELFLLPWNGTAQLIWSSYLDLRHAQYCGIFDCILNSNSVLIKLTLDQGWIQQPVDKNMTENTEDLVRWIGRQKGRRKERLRDLQSLLVWDWRRDALLLGLLPKGKVS